jgi:cytochrome c553
LDALMRIFVVVLALSAMAPAAAWAQDALAGKRLYLDVARLRGAGVSCVDCHGGLPGAAFGIGRAANQPAIVERAVNSIPQMTPLRGRLSATDYADLAAYIGRPDVPSPLLRATTSGSAARGAERMDFGAQPQATQGAVSRWRLGNDGALPLRLISAPQLRGAQPGDFTIVASECTAGLELVPGAGCSVDLAFRPTASGARQAAAFVAHDWVGGEVALALTGEGAASAPPATASPVGSSGGGGALGGGLLLLAALSWFRHKAAARSQIRSVSYQPPCRLRARITSSSSVPAIPHVPFLPKQRSTRSAKIASWRTARARFRSAASIRWRSSCCS